MIMAPRRTSLDPEERAYPRDTFTRRGRAILRPNPHNPIALPYGEIRSVRAKTPDTYFSIPARLRYRGRTIGGFLSIADSFMRDASGAYVDNPDAGEFTFTPSADPDHCVSCADGEGCKRS